MTGSVPSARKYTYGVIIVGVVGVAHEALVPAPVAVLQQRRGS